MHHLRVETRNFRFVLVVSGAGRAWVKPGVGWRYLDRWSLLDTWANQDGVFVGSEVEKITGN